MSRHREQKASKCLTLIKPTRDEEITYPSNPDASEQYRLNARGMWVDSSVFIRARLEHYTDEET